MALAHGTLVIFNRHQPAGDEPVQTEITEVASPGGRAVTLLRA